MTAQETPATEAPDAARPRRNLLVLLPLVVVAAMAAVFLVMLARGKTFLPSALIGKPVPAFALAGLPGKPGLSDADLKAGKVTLVNFFASGFPDCHGAHPYLVQLSKESGLAAQGVRLVGIAQKDQPENTRRFLGQGGDPYSAIGMDPNGRASIDFGVYGIPETFLVGPDGTILAKHVGAMTPAVFEQKFAGPIAQAKAGAR